MRVVRGRTICTNRPVNVAPGIVASGIRPRIVAYVKTGSCRMRNNWHKACRELGLDAVKVQCDGEDANGHGFLTAYDVAGSPVALEQLMRRPCVKEWHYVMDVAVGHKGTGSGDKPKRQIRPISERLIASIQAATRQGDVIAKLATITPSVVRHAALGI